MFRVILLLVCLSAPTLSDFVGDECHCQAAGDPHYRTFDGISYDFMGMCTYILAQSVEQGMECSFTVKAFQSPINPHVSYVSAVEILFMDHKVNFEPRCGLKVDNNEVRSKSVTEGDNMQIIFAGGWLTLASPKCGLRIEWEGNSVINIKLKRNNWLSKVKGLCGNCNGNPGDDFTTNNGQRVVNAVQMANTFVTHSDAHAQGRGECQVEKTPPVQPHPCRGEWEHKVRAMDLCGAFLPDQNSPFLACIRQGKVNIDMMYQACRYDVCLNRDSVNEIKRIVCTALKNLAVACSENGLDDIHWRDRCGCQINCPGNQSYKTKIEPCPASCDSKREGAKCPKEMKPKEGCGCKDGFVLYGDQCIERDKCPPKKEVSLSFKRLKQTKVEQTHNVDKAWDQGNLEEATFGDNGQPLTMKRSKTNKGHHKENKTNKQENTDLTEANFDGNGDFFGGASDFMKNFDTGKRR